MLWNLNRGYVVSSGNEKPHKCLRIFSHKTGYKNVLENLEEQSHSSPGGQNGSFGISIKDDGFPEFKINPISRRNMGLSSAIGVHSYCRVPSQQTERDGKLGVNKQIRFIGMETSSPVISENLSTEDLSRDGDQTHSWSPGSLSQAVESCNKIGSTRVFMLFHHFSWCQRFWAKFCKAKYLWQSL